MGMVETSFPPSEGPLAAPVGFMKRFLFSAEDVVMMLRLEQQGHRMESGK